MVMGWNSSRFFNLTGATYDLEGDGNNIANDNQGCCAPPIFVNSGLVRKSSGLGMAVIGVVPGYIGLAFDNSGGTVEVNSGTLVLNGGGSSVDGTFNVSAGAVLDLTGGGGPTWSGLLTGSGAGQVQFNSGSITSPGLTLNFPDGLFHWTGGVWVGTVTNFPAC